MKAALVVWIGLLTAALNAAPRFFVPPALIPGAVNEIYGWDTAVLPDFAVEVRRVGGGLVWSSKGFAVDRPLPFAAPIPWRWSAAFVAPDALDAPGPVTVTILAGKAVLWQGSSSIETVSFPSEDIPLGEAMSELRATPDDRKRREAERIWAVYKTFHPEVLVDGFQLPVPAATRQSARFGDQRRFLYSDGGTARDYHRGVDFAVPEGTPVLAAGRGRVALVADRELTGTTVVIEHAPAVYSVYFHLSRSLVKPGQLVSAGQEVALSGATGLVTGPHLHWEFRVDGTSVDPLPLVSRGLLDTNTVSGVVSRELYR